MEIVYNGEMDPRLCKAVLGETIPEILAADPDAIYLDADLMSCIGTVKSCAAYADRAVNCGIAESNMIGVAWLLPALSPSYIPSDPSLPAAAMTRCS